MTFKGGDGTLGFLSGGMDTARSQTPANVQEADARAAVRQDALAFLVRTGNADVAEVLGLVESTRKRKRSEYADSARSRKALRECPICGIDFTPVHEQVTCSRACGRVSQVRTRAAQRTRTRNPDDTQRS